MVPVRKQAPQPDRSQDPAPSYGDGLCSCGSGGSALSTGRCRSCAAKLANVTRQRRASRATGSDIAVPVHIVAQQLALGYAADDLLSEIGQTIAQHPEGVQLAAQEHRWILDLVVDAFGHLRDMATLGAELEMSIPALTDDQRDAGELLFQLRRPIHHRGRGAS